MLLTIFIFLVFFSVVLIIGGYYIDAPVTQITGTAIMFVAGLLLMFSSVEYSTGNNAEYTYIYGNNFTGYHWDDYGIPAPTFNPAQDSNVFVFHVWENNTKAYSNWDEESIGGINTRHTVAVLLLISAILIFISILSQLREGRSLDHDG